jgi:poly(3-hydroxyalkanoate) synthetase
MPAAGPAPPLDALLVDAALGPLRRFTPDASTARWVVRLARHPRTTGRRMAAPGGELATAVAGTSTVAPSRRDRRFTDPGWNSDTTRMTAKLHADLIDFGLDNRIPEPGGVTALGVPVDLPAVDVDTCIVAGIADHLTSSQNCYRSTQPLGGTSRFVQSTSGHIAALISPPGNPKAHFQTNKADPGEWLAAAETHQDSWLPDFVTWLTDRAPATKPAPEHLGGGGLTPLADAPGTYVFEP